MTSAHAGNYTPGRLEPIRYLVLHYTAGRNDSAGSNLRYFRDNVVKASAHYFVDDLGWLQSVDDSDTAWSVGTAGIYVQKHPDCRNANSISIELCCRYAAGQYVFSRKTVRNAARLTRLLMTRYGIPIENVLRHFDVVSKRCPAPWVDDESQWQAFRKLVEEELDMTKQELLSLSGTGDHPSDWAQEAVQWAKRTGIAAGDEQGNFGWQQPVTREALAVMLYRLSQLQTQKNCAGPETVKQRLLFDRKGCASIARIIFVPLGQKFHTCEAIGMFPVSEAAG